MLHIKHLELSTDQPLTSAQSSGLAHALASEIHQAWQGTAQQTNLVIDRLSVQVNAGELQRRTFVSEVAASTVDRIRRRWQQE